tara:strand:- start:993 stop:2228 length:1236 start_codon:yes stop_codon:yes gene_type:complete
MKIIWIFQTGEPLHVDGFDSRPMRAMNLANFFVKKKIKVVLWSSDFYHQKKVHRTKTFKSIKINTYLTIQLIPSLGYSKNISFKRIFDHILLALNLRKILKKNKYETPNFLIIGCPPIESSFVFLKWAQKNNIRTILDIKDQWPEVFISPFPKYLKFFVRLLLQPYFIILRYQIRNADYISTISGGFQNWIDTLNSNKDKNKNLLVPLTSPLVAIKKSKYNNIFKWWNKNGLVKGKKTICFVGSLSRAFDFKPIHKLVEYLSSMNLDINFVICGSGEKNVHIKKMMKKYDNVFFPGWINFEQIKVLYDNSYFMLAPYKNFEDFKLSIPNKVYDALSNGLPILTSLEGEVKQLIDKYEVGIHYQNEIDLCLKFHKILSSDNIRDNMSVNAKKLFNKNYNFDLVYNKFLEIID